MKPILILLLSATLIVANPPSLQDIRTHLHQRHLSSEPVLLRRAKAAKAAAPASVQSKPQTPALAQRLPGIRALTQSNQFNKLKTAASSENRHATLMSTMAAGNVLMDAGSAIGGGPAEAMMAAGQRISSIGALGMAAHQAWELGRGATKPAKSKKTP